MLTLTDTQQAIMTLAVSDIKGGIAKTDGTPKWFSSDDRVAIVTDISADGMSATVKATGLGLCRVTTLCRDLTDVALGSGVRIIVGSIDITVVSKSVVVTIGLTVGPITEQSGYSKSL